MNEYYVYEWIRHDTLEPFYVGKGKNNRCFQYKKNRYFKNIINYCNKNNILVSVSILEKDLTEKEAFDIECWYIHNYIFEYGFNLTNLNLGGEGGNNFIMMTSEQQEKYRIRMSKSLMGKNKGHHHSSETKKKISELNKGRLLGIKNPMYKKSCKDFMTAEDIKRWRINIGKASSGRKHTEETKIKISNSHIGKKYSEESKKKMSQSRIGSKNHRYGKHLSNKHKEIISKAHTKSTKAELNGEVLYFESRNKCYEYFHNNYDVGIFIIKKLLKSGHPYSASQKKLKPIDGLIITYI